MRRFGERGGFLWKGSRGRELATEDMRKFMELDDQRILESTSQDDRDADRDGTSEGPSQLSHGAGHLWARRDAENSKPEEVEIRTGSKATEVLDEKVDEVRPVQMKLLQENPWIPGLQDKEDEQDSPAMHPSKGSTLAPVTSESLQDEDISNEHTWLKEVGIETHPPTKSSDDVYAREGPILVEASGSSSWTRGLDGEPEDGVQIEVDRPERRSQAALPKKGTTSITWLKSLSGSTYTRDTRRVQMPKTITPGLSRQIMDPIVWLRSEKNPLVAKNKEVADAVEEKKNGAPEARIEVSTTLPGQEIANTIWKNPIKGPLSKAVHRVNTKDARTMMRKKEQSMPMEKDTDPNRNKVGRSDLQPTPDTLGIDGNLSYGNFLEASDSSDVQELEKFTEEYSENHDTVSPYWKSPNFKRSPHAGHSTESSQGLTQEILEITKDKGRTRPRTLVDIMKGFENPFTKNASYAINTHEHLVQDAPTIEKTLEDESRGTSRKASLNLMYKGRDMEEQISNLWRAVEEEQHVSDSLQPSFRRTYSRDDGNISFMRAGGQQIAISSRSDYLVRKILEPVEFTMKAGGQTISFTLTTDGIEEWKTVSDEANIDALDDKETGLSILSMESSMETDDAQLATSSAPSQMPVAASVPDTQEGEAKIPYPTSRASMSESIPVSEQVPRAISRPDSSNLDEKSPAGNHTITRYMSRHPDKAKYPAAKTLHYGAIENESPKQESGPDDINSDSSFHLNDNYIGLSESGIENDSTDHANQRSSEEPSFGIVLNTSSVQGADPPTFKDDKIVASPVPATPTQALFRTDNSFPGCKRVELTNRASKLDKILVSDETKDVSGGQVQKSRNFRSIFPIAPQESSHKSSDDIPTSSPSIKGSLEVHKIAETCEVVANRVMALESLRQSLGINPKLTDWEKELELVNVQEHLGCLETLDKASERRISSNWTLPDEDLNEAMGKAEEFKILKRFISKEETLNTQRLNELNEKLAQEKSRTQEIKRVQRFVRNEERLNKRRLDQLQETSRERQAAESTCRRRCGGG